MPQDFRYGLRMLRKSPTYTLAAILALGLGIGANTTIFSVINAVLLQPLPYKDPDRLVRLYESQLPQFATVPVTRPDFLDWKERQRVFERIVAYSGGSGTSVNLTGVDRPERLSICPSTDGMFALLGIAPILGRDFLPEEDQPGRNNVLILSNSFWQRRFASDPGVIGRTVLLNGEPHIIVGVMPPFRFLKPFGGGLDGWVPMALVRNENQRFSHAVHVVARLKPGVSLDQARAEMASISAQIEKEHPRNYGKVAAVLIPVFEDLSGYLRKPMALLLAAVGFVLLIACANVANLLLARGATRFREVSIRATLGAGRLRLLRLLLTESLILGVSGGMVGLLLALWGVDLLGHARGIGIPRLDRVAIDNRVLAYTAGISILTSLVFGLVPALQLSGAALHESLKESGPRAAGGRSSSRLRGILVVTETALALILLIGAGLTIRSVNRLLAVDIGIRTERLLAVELNLPRARYGKYDQLLRFWNDLEARVNGLPGVKAAGATQKLPLRGGWNGYVTVEGQPDTPGRPVVEFSYITPGYFQTAGIRLLRGRLFTEADRAASGQAGLIINETFARRIWPNLDPIGRRIKRGDDWSQIVGVVSDTRQWSVQQPPLPELYHPYVLQSMTLLVRTETEPKSLVEAIRREVLAVDKDIPIYGITTMDQIASDSTVTLRFYTKLLSIFAVVAIVLAAVGIYGVIAYTVSQRSHELGIRMAMGAGRADTVRLVVGQAAKLLIAGIAAGVGGAIALSRFLEVLLYEIKPTDPITYASVALFLAVIGLTASALPAIRASRVDPMSALRHE